MALRDYSALIVSDEDSVECLTVEASAQVVERGGFAVDDSLSLDPPLVSRRFVVSEDPAERRVGWLNELEVRYPISYYAVYGLAPGSLGSCADGHLVRFRLEFDHDAGTARVRVRINISGRNADRDAKQSFRREIEEAWSDRYVLVATGGHPPRDEYRILVDVDWVDEDADPHYSVRLRPGCGRDEMERWYDASPDLVAAHEFGHMLGNIDEYPGDGDGCPDRPVVDPSLMNSEAFWPWPHTRHYYLIQRAAEEALCATFTVSTREPGLAAETLPGGSHVFDYAAWGRTCKPEQGENRTLIRGLIKVLIPLWF